MTTYTNYINNISANKNVKIKISTNLVDFFRWQNRNTHSFDDPIYSPANFNKYTSLAKNISNIFYGRSDCYNIPIYNFVNATELNYMYYGSSVSSITMPPNAVNMYEAFGNTDITTCPNIPNSVINMAYTFWGCEYLKTPPVLSANVTNLCCTFASCRNLTTAPTIPSKVIDMHDTFSSCYNLKTPPTIPQGVVNMEGTFSQCNNLTTAPNIPSTVTNLAHTFWKCDNLAGSFYIHSNNVSNAYQCFGYSTRNGPMINVFVHAGTTTYNSILSSIGGVSTSNTALNVYLKTF